MNSNELFIDANDSLRVAKEKCISFLCRVGGGTTACLGKLARSPTTTTTNDNDYADDNLHFVLKNTNLRWTRARLMKWFQFIDYASRQLSTSLRSVLFLAARQQLQASAAVSSEQKRWRRREAGKCATSETLVDPLPYVQDHWRCQ